ncbi:MAG: hypothetical protein AVDCRST_MAG77-1300 [uncultured Chloroflexi bacterium]|uniref:Uncharacterized protein n=1 Tax=uncultured Chloroflexota bacterium TaxID=166587 RepID=A0A6J4HVY0_9CHLR|nr:MAG: hypothetical protein AVDCRST_MAG77-1300 [uncultured Chloroflexota bacterium]
MLAPGVPAYRRLCAAPLDTFPVLATAREEATRAAAAQAGVART